MINIIVIIKCTVSNWYLDEMRTFKIKIDTNVVRHIKYYLHIIIMII